MRQRGFTLIELVAVIVLLSVVGISVFGLFRIATSGYVETTRRNELAQAGRWTVERLSRELRNALPASVRVLGSAPTVQCLEFMPIEAASSYLNLPVTGAAASFDAVAFSLATVRPDHRVAVYPLSPADVYDAASGYTHPLDSLGAVGAGQRSVNFAAAVTFTTDSPEERFFIVGGPVAFCVQNGDLTRHSGYGLVNTHGSLPPAAGSSALLAENLQQVEGGANIAVFDYTPGTLQRAGIVHLDLRFASSDAPEELVRFSHAVSIRNTP